MKTKEELSCFCKNVVYLRLKNNLSKTKMAEIMGIGIGSLTKIEKGIVSPKVEVIVIFNLARHFKIHITELFSEL